MGVLYGSIWHFSGAHLDMYICVYIPPSLFIPLSFPAGHRQGPRLRNPFTTQLVEEQNFINPSVWWMCNSPMSQKTSLSKEHFCIFCEGSLYRALNTVRFLWSGSRLPFSLTSQHLCVSAPLLSPVRFLKLTDAMVVLVTQRATLHGGAFAHSTASSPEPDRKGAYPGSNTSQLCDLQKATELLFTSTSLSYENYRGQQYYLHHRAVERTTSKCMWSVQNTSWLRESTS